MRSMIRRRARLLVAGVGIAVIMNATGCSNTPLNPQSRGSNNIPKTSMNNGPSSGNGGMASSGQIPTPPGSGGSTTNGMGPGNSMPGGMPPGGMNSGVVPVNGMSNPNGSMMNRQTSMTNPQMGGSPGFSSGPVSNQQMTGSPGYYDRQPTAGGNMTPIATNNGASSIQPVNYNRPVGNPPMNNAIPTQQPTDLRRRHPIRSKRRTRGCSSRLGRCRSFRPIRMLSRSMQAATICCRRRRPRGLRMLRLGRRPTENRPRPRTRTCATIEPLLQVHGRKPVDLWFFGSEMKYSMRLLVLIGCGLRLIHYLRDPSVWHDEAALIVNVLRLDFGQLLGPLLWNEAGPPLFLWLERLISLVLGDSTLAFRLVPMLVSCASLALIAASVERWLPPRGAFCAVLLIAISDRLLWHSCEAKPYAMDVFLASLLLFIFTFADQWSAASRAIFLSVMTPFMIFVSFPACFLCGGLWLAMLPAAWNSGRWRDRLLHVGWAVIIVGAFAALYFGPIRAQRTGPMEGCWAGHFPNWSKPMKVPVWSVANTVEMLRYAFKPLGSFFVILAAIGGYQVWRRRSFSGIAFLVVPFGLAWVAALFGGYPYGGSRLEIFTAPALAILVVPESIRSASAL